MALEICEKVWSTQLPPLSKCTDSPCYRLDGGDWYFRLSTHLSNSFELQEFWTMRFIKQTKNEKQANFLLTVYVRVGTRELFMANRLITEVETKIWGYGRNEFIRRYPQVVISSELTFVFRIDYNIRNKEFQITKREHKSVQTSSSTPPTAYLDDRHCLENLSFDLRKLMDGGWDPDVQLKCGDCTIPAHKLVLGARSEVFRTMLHTDMREGRQGAVEIVDMEPETLRVFVRYLYTGSFPELSEDVALALFVAGDKYQVRALMARCSSFLAGNLTREKACGILVLADAHGDEGLKDRVVSYILEEKIPKDSEVWSEFCSSHPQLAVQVLNLAYQQS